MNGSGASESHGEIVSYFQDFSDNLAPVDLQGYDYGDILRGGLDGDLLTGKGGSDTLDGGTGNDVLEGGAGADRLIGGAGIDTASYEHAEQGVNVDFSGRRAGSGDALGDTFSGIEFLRGSRFDDALFGSAARDIIEGGGGGDVIVGNGGADVASYEHSAAGVTVDLGLQGKGAQRSAGDASGDVLVGIRDLIGSALNDTLTGDASANTLNGGAGNDRLNGGTGADSLAGGTGNDIYYVDSAADVVREAAGEGTDSVYASVSYTLAAGQEVERLYGNAGAMGLALTGNAGVNALYGGAGNDTLAGGDGADALSGGEGADVLTGGAGSDRLTGGVGADLFVLGAASDSGGSARDTIYDFVIGTDHIDLSAIDASSATAGDQAFNFAGDAAFQRGAAGQVRAVQSGANTLVQADVNGDARADLQIVLAGVTAADLTAADFVL